MTAPDFREVAQHLTDSQLAIALQANGWERYGGQALSYSRWRPATAEGESIRGLLLPENRDASDYSELLSQAVARAWNLGDNQVRSILKRAASVRSLGDEMKFHKESRPTRGEPPSCRCGDRLRCDTASVEAHAIPTLLIRSSSRIGQQRS